MIDTQPQTKHTTIMNIPLNYPVTRRLEHRLWLHTCFHPFGFSVGDNGRPSIDIRISDESLFKSVPMEDRIEYMMESHARMLELGYISQGKDERGFITLTEARGVLWYWLPAAQALA